MNAQIGYPVKFGGRRMDVQLNIDNLLDYNEPRYNGLFVHTLAGKSVNVPYGFKNVWPRSVRLTITMPF